jgi:putative tryptophan/tyrosine transport system substrate-binding protein
MSRARPLLIEWRFADGNYERLPDLAVELTRLDLEVIVTYGTAAAQALKQATSSTPIVDELVINLRAGRRSTG